MKQDGEGIPKPKKEGCFIQRILERGGRWKKPKGGRGDSRKKKRVEITGGGAGKKTLLPEASPVSWTRERKGLAKKAVANKKKREEKRSKKEKLLTTGTRSHRPQRRTPK